MVKPLTPPANGFVAKARKIHNPVGFQKGYNFILWFIFAGALMGFTLARFMFLDIPGIFCGTASRIRGAAPGECYYYNNFSVYHVGIRIHLYCILPAAFLVCFQFTPVFRHKVMIFHRINGCLVILLSLVANAGAIMIARRAFGGTLATQTYVGALVIVTTLGSAMAYYNIKRLQIDQHRAWMLRTWFYFSTIVTLRIIMLIAAQVVTAYGDFYLAQPCAKVNFILKNSTTLTRLYPSCAAFVSGANPDAQTVVRAYFGGNPVEIATALNTNFGMAGWLAFLLHAVGVEIYLHLTPRESERLRTVSYQRQLEAGMKNPGNAGTTPQRLGDANDFNPLLKELPSKSQPMFPGHRESDTTIAGTENVQADKNEADEHTASDGLEQVPSISHQNPNSQVYQPRMV